MSYSIFRTNGSLLTNIPDGTVNTASTPLSLPGRNFASYGQIVDTNFVHQLENFANVTPPANAIIGQLWYDTTPLSEGLYVCPTDGETNPNNWIPILTPNNIGNITVDNLISLGNITANNATITNNANANVISTNYLTVNVQANIANANITGNAVAANLRTANITTSATSIPGTLTGSWTINGGATINSIPGTSLYVAGGNVVIDAGIKTDDYYYANGDPVSFDGTYTNSNVAAYLPTYEGNVGVDAGNTVFNGRTLSTGANVTTGTITGNWTLSAGSQINGLSDIAGANVTGTVANAAFATSAGTANSATTAQTVTNNAQPNITSTGTLTGLNVSGNANFTGQLVSLGSNGNVSITGGSAGQVLSTNGSGGLIWVSAAAADTAITVTANAQPNITSVGTLTSLGVNGNITAANITANTGVFTGNGSGLSALNASNLSTGTVPSGRLSGSYSISVTSATTAGTVTTAAQPNITSVGTLTSASVTGNVTAGNVYANSGTIGASSIAGTLTTASQPNITSVGTLTGLLASGNVAFTGQVVNLGTVGNLRITGGLAGQVLTSTGSGGLTWSSAAAAETAITVTANAQPNITSTGTLTSLNVSGNISSGNVSVSGRFVGNAAGLTNIPGANVTGQVANSLSAGTVYSNSQPNITSVGTLTSLNVSGNITASNVSVSGRFVGNASGLNSIPGANVTGTVPSASFATSAGSATTATSAGTANTANTATNATNAVNAFNATNADTATRAGTVTTAAQPNITSVGTLTSLAVSGSLTRGGQNVLTLGDFTSSASSPGWVRLPNGLLLQFGTATVFRQTFTSISYPISFSSFSVAVISGSTQSSADGSQGGPGVTFSGTTGFTAYVSTDASGPAITVQYVAIGF